MLRQWQEFFYDKRYVATPLVAPDFAALANAFGIHGERITKRAEVLPTIRSARESAETVLIDFRVEQEDSVYPMVAAGASLSDMIRRPNNPLVRSEEHTSELQSHSDLVCRLLLEKKKRERV